MKDIPIHLHKRKRMSRKDLKYPHPNPRVRFLDEVVLVVAIIIPFSTLPQIYRIWSNKDATGISLITWVLYFVFSIPLLIYAVVHKEKPLIIMYSIWLLVHASMIIGTLLYS